MARAYSSWIERCWPALIVGVCLFAGSCAGSEDVGAESIAEPSPVEQAEALVVESGWEQQLEDARLVLVQVEQLLDEEQLLGRCPMEGLPEDRSLSGLAEAQGALMCFSENSSGLPDVSIGASLPDHDFFLTLDQVGESVDVGLGAVTVRCNEGMCIGLWAAQEIVVFAVVFESGSQERARVLVTESIDSVVNWVSDFDLTLIEQ